MGLTDALGGIAVRHAHVLAVEAPGHWVTRVAVERHVLARGWRLALSPGDADILAVCGPPRPDLTQPLMQLWEQMPGPRTRVEIDSPQAVLPALDTAEANLRDTTRQRADSRDRPDDHAWAGHDDLGEHHTHERHAPHDRAGQHTTHPGPPGGDGGQHAGTGHDLQADHVSTDASSAEAHEGMHHRPPAHDAHGDGGHSERPPGDAVGNGEHANDSGRERGDHDDTGPGDNGARAPVGHAGDRGAEHAGHEGMASAGHGAHRGHPAHAGAEHADHGGMGHAGGGAMMHAGHGGMGHGGMDMAPGGIPLAAGGEDRDGLEMDLLHLRLGPVLAYWPAGLVLRCTLQGDVIVDAASLVGAEDAADTGGAEQGDAADDLRRFAARRCDNVVSLLGLAGWDHAASRARRIRDALLFTDDLNGPAGELHRLRRMVGRSWLLRWSLRRLGPFTAQELARRGLPTTMKGDVRDRLLGMLDRAARSIADQHTGQSGGTPIEAIPDLVRGWDLATARLIVASLDLDPLSADREVSHV